MGPKTRSLACHLAALPDPRKIQGQRHVLLDILLIAILAELCGADSWSLDALARAASTGGGHLPIW